MWQISSGLRNQRYTDNDTLVSLLPCSVMLQVIATINSFLLQRRK